MSDIPSRSQVEKAGKRLRQIARGERQWDELDPWLEVIERHRATFAQPMLSANVGMRRYAAKLDLDVTVSQRLKRMWTIIEKLTDRESRMNLARMRDIGGVRVVLNNIDDLRRFQSHVEKSRRRDGVETIDYIDQPRASGYRAVHLICMYSRATPRPVEVQLRTQTMHNWAEMVERVSGIVGVNHKQDGDTAFHQWALLYSRILEAIELGKPSPVSDDEFSRAWDKMIAERRW